MQSQFHISERRACRVLKQHRSTQRKQPKGRADEERLRDLVSKFPNDEKGAHVFLQQYHQDLVRVTRTDAGFETESLLPVRFVALVEGVARD